MLYVFLKVKLNTPCTMCKKNQKSCVSFCVTLIVVEVLLYDFHLYCGSEKNHLCYIAKRDTPQYISKINSVVQIYEQNLNVQIFVGLSGFEPEPREPKSLVLPLHHNPIPPALSHGRAPDSHLLVRVHGPRRHYRNAINVQSL